MNVNTYFGSRAFRRVILWRHPERRRFSAGAKDLFNYAIVCRRSLRPLEKTRAFGMTPLKARTSLCGVAILVKLGFRHERCGLTADSSFLASLGVGMTGSFARARSGQKCPLHTDMNLL
jgi:hypothetical protein